MKALLITVIIVLTVLLVIAVFLQRQKLSKLQEKKETFVGIVGLPPSGGSTSGGFDNFEMDAIMKLDSEVSGIKDSGEKLSKDFAILKTDTDTKIQTINTRNDQYQTNLNGKITTLQESNKTLFNKTNSYDSSMTNFTNKFAATDSNIAVINGKLINLTNVQTSNNNNLLFNINDLKNKQTAYDAQMNKNLTNVFTTVNAELSSLSGNMNSKLAANSSDIKSLNTNYNYLSSNFNTYTVNQAKFNADQQNSVNTIKQTSIGLSDSITTAQKRISELNNIFGNYTTTKDLQQNYALKGELAPFLTQTNLANYVTVADSAKFASTNELKKYAQLSNLNNYTLKTDADSKYAFKTDLKQYALSSNLQQQYLGKMEAPLLFASKNDLPNYTPKTDFTPVATAVNDAKKSLDLLKPVVDMIKADYVKKTELPKLTAPETSSTTQLTSALDATKKIVDSLTLSLGTVKASLTEYTKKSDAEAAYARFAYKSDLIPYARTSDLSMYATNSNLQAQYASKNDLTAYAKLTDLSQYGKTADLNKLYATNVVLGEYVKTNAMMSNLASRDMVVQQKIDVLANSIASKTSTLNQSTSSIMDTLEIKTILKAAKIRAHSSTYNQTMPPGWNDGLMSADIYATGKIGAGLNGSVESSMNSTGEITGRKFKSTGDSNAWNWYHVYRNDADQLYFGGDANNRGIMSVGPRDFSIYTNGTNRMSINSNGQMTVAGNSAFTGPAVFNGATVFTNSTTMSNATVSGNINVNGTTTITGNTILNSNANVKGNTVLQDVWGQSGDYQSLGTKNLWVNNALQTNLNVLGQKVINFGSDQPKAQNAGTIGYGTLDGGSNGSLNIVGAGLPGQSNKVVKVWNNLVANNAIGVGGDMDQTWRGANFKRNDGKWTQFDWKDDGKNYIRGDTQFDNSVQVNGNETVNGNFDAATVKGRNNICVNDICMSRDEFNKAKTGSSSSAVNNLGGNIVVANPQDGSVNINTKTIRLPGDNNINTAGRQHISGNELLYILNKNGAVIGKEWGGNGNLQVQGDATVGKLILPANRQVTSDGTGINFSDRLVVNGGTWGAGWNGKHPSHFRGEMIIENGNGSITHFNHLNQSLNYIRGNTQVDGDLRVNGRILLNGLTITPGSDGNSYVITAQNGQQLSGGNLRDRLWVRSRNNNSDYWYWNNESQTNSR